LFIDEKNELIIQSLIYQLN